MWNYWWRCSAFLAKFKMQQETGIHLLQWRTFGCTYWRYRKKSLLYPSLKKLDWLYFFDLLLLFFWFIAPESGFCTAPWIPYNGHCFYLYRNETKKWSDAQKACRKEGGDLVTIRNVEDQSFIISQLGYGMAIKTSEHHLHSFNIIFTLHFSYLCNFYAIAGE